MRSHVHSSIQRLLELEDEMLIAMFQRPINWIREDLNERLADGELLIGSADCEGFSPTTGCPGHPTTFLEKYGNVEIRSLYWKQPFASLMLHGKVETRVWHARYRGWVLICASKTPYSIPKMEAIAGRQNARINETLQCEPKDLPLGQAIAIGYLYSSQPMSNFLVDHAMNEKSSVEKGCFVQYNEDLWCHSYRDVQPIVPFDWKGSQGWRILSDEVKGQIKFL